MRASRDKRITHRQAGARRTGWKGDALKPGTRTVHRLVPWRDEREVPSPGTGRHHGSTAAAAAAEAAGEKIIRLEVVRRIISVSHKPTLIREVLHGFSSFLMPVASPFIPFDSPQSTCCTMNPQILHLHTLIILKYDSCYKVFVSGYYLFDLSYITVTVHLVVQVECMFRNVMQLKHFNQGYLQ